MKLEQSQRREETAVDDEIGAGDVCGPVAREEKYDVGDFTGLSEPAGDHLGSRLACYLLRLRAGRGAHRLGDAAGTEPQVRGNRAGADCVNTYAMRSDFF